jgi:AraC-like DNA-binding protein/mannose-6-phosphate isomerase-like protein (cupin superfamily)
MDTFDITKAEGVFVRCNSGGVFNCAPEWDWRVNNMSDHDIWFVCGGRGRFESGSRSWDISAGDCFFIPPGTALYASHDPSNPLSAISSHLDIIDPEGRAVIPVGGPRFHTKISDFFFIERLMSRVVENFLTGRRHEADMWLNTVVLELIRMAEPREQGGAGRYTREINGICAAIAAEPWKDYPISELAARIHVCGDHFSRIFKGIMRISPIDFIVNCRIEYARSLLVTSNYPVKAVAQMCGYSSVYYFSKHFKARTGLSPSRFRESKAGV